MSGGNLITAALWATAAAGAVSAYSSYEGNKSQKKAQRKAFEQQQAIANQAQDAQAQEYNRANQRSHNFSFINPDGGGTMLTGPQGVSDDDMLLGRKSLLGGAPSVGK